MSTDRPDLDDPRVLALAKARQQVAHAGMLYPTWDELTDQERTESLPDARSYLHAALLAGLIPTAASPTADDGYRQQIATALITRIKQGIAPTRPGAVGSLFAATDLDLADAVLAVRDHRMEQLLAELARCVEAADAPTTPATTCSARYTGVLPVGECIRAAGHITVTDHTDDRGRNWGDSLAEYPVFDGPLREAPAADDAPAKAACRRMETRTCPDSYNGPCGERPCARFESDDPAPWLAAAAPAADDAPEQQ